MDVPVPTIALSRVRVGGFFILEREVRLLAIDPDVVRAIGERVDDALDGHAAGLLTAYFKPEGPFAGATFDTLGTNERNRIGEDDLLAVTLLDLRVPALAVRRLLGEDEAAAGAAIGDIPDDVDLWEADDDQLARAQAAWDRLKDYAGVGPVIAGKLLARKRPRLVPIFDSVVGTAVGAPEGHFWVALGECLAEGGRHSRIEGLRPAGLSPKVSTLRIFDVAIWMRFSRGRYAKASRRELGMDDQ